MRLTSFVISEGRGREVSQDQAIQTIKTKCKKALSLYLKDGDTLLRGLNGGKDFMHVAPKTSMPRESAYTDNYYTLILDNDPRWKSFPKRSQSIVCSTDFYKAKVYGTSYRVFSYDGSRYGVCPKDDIWYSFKETFGMPLGTVNGELNMLGELCDVDIGDTKTYSDLVKYLNEIDKKIVEILKQTETEYYDDDMEALNDNDLFKKWNSNISFTKWFLDQFDPQKNDFYVTTDISKVFSTGVKSKEVWTDGESVLINYHLSEYEMKELLTK